jgi:hypothetical protein
MLIGGSVAWAATGGLADLNSQPAAKTAVVSAAPIDTSTESKFTAITPCRIVDTRVAGGPIAAGASRGFAVSGATGFVGQGGTNGGCGVPTAATAVALTMVAVDETGVGYLRQWPAGVAMPFSSFLNYAGTDLVSTGGTATITGTANPALNVSANIHSSNVVIDVQGYYIKPMYAHVESDGTILSGSRVTSSASLSIGQYEVIFDRDVSGCAYNVSVDPDTGYTLKTQPRSGNANGVFVRIGNLSGTNTAIRFYLTVTC